MKILTIALLLGTTLVHAQSTTTDIEYACVGDHLLKLDLHTPKATNPPLLVYIHGGAWRAGSKSDVPVARLLEHGFAIASVDYRLSPQALFPAQIHDIKAAIRFLRAKSELYRINAKRIGIIGSSAGGHLAALVGVTNGHKTLEGEVGDHLDQSSDVHVVVSLFGASNLQTILSQSTEFGLQMRIPALKLLLGNTPDQKADLAKIASPVEHLDKNDPPLLLVHGDADPQMPFAQSQEFARAYKQSHLPVQLMVMSGSRHGGDEFYDEERTSVLAQFLQRHLLQP